MRGKELFEKFTNIEDEIINEVAQEQSEENVQVEEHMHVRKLVLYRKWAALAACIIGLIAVYPIATELLNPDVGEGSDFSISTTTTEGAMDATGTAEPAVEESTEEALEESTQEESTQEESITEESITEEDAELEQSQGSVQTESGASEIGGLEAFLDKYVDISNMPIYDMELEKNYVADDRVVTLETSIDNELEDAVYTTFIEADSDDYLCDSIIYDMRVLEQDEVQEVEVLHGVELGMLLEEYHLVETGIVYVDVSWNDLEGDEERTYESYPEGRYEKYYIVGLEEGSSDYKIYGVYR